MWIGFHMWIGFVVCQVRRSAQVRWCVALEGCLHLHQLMLAAGGPLDRKHLRVRLSPLDVHCVHLPAAASCQWWPRMATKGEPRRRGAR